MRPRAHESPRLLCCGLLRLAAGVACLWGPLARAQDGRPADVVGARLQGRVFFVPVLLNGRGPYPFILDTGATDTVVTPATAVRAGLATRPWSGSQRTAVAATLAVGAAQVERLQVFVFDPPQALALRLNEGLDYGGILGYTFLARFVTTFDYPRGTVRLDPVERVPGGGAAGHPEGGFAIPFRLIDRLIHVSVAVDETRALTFLLDTGAAETLLMPETAERLRLRGTPVTGDAGWQRVVLGRVALGTVVATDTPAVIHRLPGERSAGASYAGILGYPFLLPYAVTVDYAARTVSFVAAGQASGGQGRR